MANKLNDAEIAEMADDIDNLYGLHHGHRRATGALEIALLAVLDTLEDKFPGMREIVVADMREAAEKQRSFMRMQQETNPACDISEDDIEEELDTLEDLIFKLERRMITE